jgi:2-oxoglutarate ferredoxin oxidoreductase subunit delta
MVKITGRIDINVERCKGCGVCIGACPFNLLALSGKVNHKGYNYLEVKEQERCTGCANCAVVCPDCIITVYRRKEE